MSNVAPLQLLSAVVVLNASLEGWSLLEPAEGSEGGARSFRYPVIFGRSFSTVPVVQVGIVGLDVSKEDNVRVRVRAVDILDTGFTLQADTWLNTKIWSVDVSWLAIGA
jgi:hypothetical protein